MNTSDRPDARDVPSSLPMDVHFFQRLVETSHDLIAAVDAAGRWTFLNDAARRIYGYEPEEMLGRPFSDFADPEQALLDQQAFARMRQGHKVFSHEARHRRKDGSPVWLNFNGVAVFDAQGNMTGAVGTAQDVTERKQVEQALAESEAKFRRMFDSDIQGMVFSNIHGTITRANDTFLKMVGYSREELEAGLIRWREMTPPEYAPLDEQALREVAATGRIMPFEKEFIRRDGTRIPVLVGGAAFASNPEEGICFVQDISGRKRAEEMLRQSDARFHGLFQAAPDAILIVDQQRTILDANAATERLFGYAPGELQGKPVEILVPVAVRVRHEQHCANFDREGRPRPMGSGLDLFGCRKDGSEFPVDIMLGPLALEGARFTLCVVRDITERRRAEERARHLAMFPELNPNPVLEFAADGALVYQNPAANTMVLKIGATGLADILPADTVAIVADCLATGQPRQQLVTAHGRNTFSWSFHPVGAQRVVHCYIADITERTQLEEQLRQAQKLEAVGQLAGGVAHDFNNLLTAIIGHLGLLQDNPKLTPDMNESITEIARAANRAANLTSQLLAFSRQQVIDIHALDLNDVAAQLGKLLRRLLGEDIAIHQQLAPERLVFRGDSGMIEQVVVNLAVNARDAMSGGGTLRITTGSERRERPGREGQSAAPQPESFVCLTIGDSGCGIPPEILPRIFDPFFTTKEVGKGSGLGLATAFGIVQQHEGWIEVESEPGKGTVFRILLPRFDAAPETHSETQAPLAERGQGEVILLVEDDATVRTVGQQALKRKGYTVLTAANGPAALELWKERREDIRLVITDLIMPGGLSGLQLAKLLQGERPGLRVIYTSGYSREIAGKELVLADDTNYLPKPYELEKLFKLVRSVLDARSSRSPFPSKPGGAT